MKKTWKFFLVLSILAISFAASADQDGKRAECKICGMYIDQYRATSGRLTLKSGKIFETCGVACLIRTINDQGGPDAFSKIEVRDWQSKVLVPAAEASYVIGSRRIPDMMPNLIAFQRKEDAEAFREKEGGELLNFTQALMSISPMGMTMPVRLKTAVLSPQGGLGVGAGYMHMTMDKVKLGSETVDPSDLARRPGQISAPKQMTVDAAMVMVNYGLTDNLNLGISAPYYEKKMETYKQSGRVTETTSNSGLGDIEASIRYNLWKDAYYSKFLSLLAGTTLPTGSFKQEFITMPGLQNGAGTFTFTGGLLFSQRLRDFWLHYQAAYTAGLKNPDDYRFGDTTRLGLALHYTPTYDFMVGLEVDGLYFAKDQYRGDALDNTGGFRSNLAGVVDWKFLTAFGGNFSLRAWGGVPLYEDLNHATVGRMEKAKMGGGYFASISINFNRRIAFLE